MFYLLIISSFTPLYYHSTGNRSTGNVKEGGRNAFGCKGKTTKGISTLKSEVAEFFSVVLLEIYMLYLCLVNFLAFVNKL
jgi:hypothetical protein